MKEIEEAVKKNIESLFSTSVAAGTTSGN